MSYSRVSIVTPRPTIIEPPATPSRSSRLGLRASHSRARPATTAHMLSEQIATLRLREKLHSTPYSKRVRRSPPLEDISANG